MAINRLFNNSYFYNHYESILKMFLTIFDVTKLRKASKSLELYIAHKSVSSDSQSDGIDLS
jgi:hypothetical protein